MSACAVCESPLPTVPHEARMHCFSHWADYIITSMEWRATDAGRWLDFDPWWRAQENLSKELEVKHG